MTTKIGCYTFERMGHAGLRIHYDNNETGGVSLGVHDYSTATTYMIAALCEHIEALQAEVAEMRQELRDALPE
jgi:hypothetical protein